MLSYPKGRKGPADGIGHIIWCFTLLRRFPSSTPFIMTA